MKLYKIIGILLAAYLLISCSRTALVRKSFDSALPNVDTLSILFPRVVYVEKNRNVERAKTGHSIYVSQNIAYVLKEIIDEGKFAAQSATILYDTLMIGQWAQAELPSSVTRFKEMRDSLQKGTSSGNIFSVFPEWRSLLDKSNSRYALCVDGIAYGTSEHSKQFDLLQRETFDRFYGRPYVYEYQWIGLQLRMFLVDAKSGEILWNNSNGASDSKYDPLRKEDVRDLCLKLLGAN
jgi:hypothetical protein